jgi:hypothetical protein
MTRERGFVLILIGFVLSAVSLLLSEPASQPGAIRAVLGRELVLKPGVYVRVPNDRKPDRSAAVDIATTKMNVKILDAPRTTLEKKSKILSSVDPDFNGLPDKEKRRVLQYLNTGELIGLYINEAGYRLDSVLGPDHYVGRVTVALANLLALSVVLFSLGVYFVLCSKRR